MVSPAVHAAPSVKQPMAWARQSAVPYLASLVITFMAAAWVNYLVPLTHPEGITFKGQALAIVIPFVAFPITFVLWLMYRGQRSRSPWFTGFVAAMALAWLIHMVIIWGHHDLYTHTVWLFVPILALIYFKAPTSQDAWTSVVVWGWTAVVILVATRLLEIAGLVPIFHIEQWIIDWEKERYWLPLSGYLGLDGRWPGPFGFNSKTGFISVCLVLIAITRWRRWSSPVFVVVGVLGILLTGGRGSALSLFAGALIIVLFSSWSPFTRIAPVWRAGFTVVAMVVLGLVFFFSPLGSTGRTATIWPAFLDQWHLSPLFGVGQSGLSAAGGQVGISMEAHSLYIEELAKFGLVGFASQYLAIGIGVIVMGIAAYKGFAGPLGLIVAFLVASLTEVFTNGWQLHSNYSLLLVLCVAAAAMWLVEGRDGSAPIAPGTTDESARIPVDA